MSGKEKTKEMVVDNQELPIIIKFISSSKETKEYILKTNSAKDKLLLNKKDY